MASNRPPLKKLPPLKRLAESAAKYTPLLRTGAQARVVRRGSDTQQAAPRDRPRPTRSASAASLAKGLQQISRLPQGGGHVRPPTPTPPSVPRAPTSAPRGSIPPLQRAPQQQTAKPPTPSPLSGKGAAPRRGGLSRRSIPLNRRRRKRTRAGARNRGQTRSAPRLTVRRPRSRRRSQLSRHAPRSRSPCWRRSERPRHSYAANDVTAGPHDAHDAGRGASAAARDCRVAEETAAKLATRWRGWAKGSAGDSAAAKAAATPKTTSSTIYSIRSRRPTSC